MDLVRRLTRSHLCPSSQHQGCPRENLHSSKWPKIRLNLSRRPGNLAYRTTLHPRVHSESGGSTMMKAGLTSIIYKFLILPLTKLKYSRLRSSITVLVRHHSLSLWAATSNGSSASQRTNRSHPFQVASPCTASHHECMLFHSRS